MLSTIRTNQREKFKRVFKTKLEEKQTNQTKNPPLRIISILELPESHALTRILISTINRSKAAGNQKRKTLNRNYPRKT